MKRSIVALQKHVTQIWGIQLRCHSTAALYVHWPYCKRRCTYCNFNKYIEAFKDAGVNRVSIGVQTFNNTGLQILGRDHTAAESLRCLDMAKRLFPGHVSVDLIFGWPGQTLSMWMSELDQVITHCDNHISLYQLTLERGTQLFKNIQAGSLTAVDSLVMEEMYLQAVEMLASRGFERYEVSNFARKECYSQHNLSYWTGHQYIGIGPGAHGRFRPVKKDLREARVQTLEPNDWMWEVEQYGHATRKSSPLSILQQLEELLIVGLRIKQGITNEVWARIYPEKSLKEILLPSPYVKSLVHSGLLIFDDNQITGGLRATHKGINVIDSILPGLMNSLEEGFKSACDTAVLNESTGK